MKNFSKNENDFPFISIVIPCRNEREFIGRCLGAIVEQTYPKDKIEVIIVDGKSEDGTKEVVKKWQQKFPFIRLLENPKKITPSGMNIGVKNSKGELITVISAHCVLDKNFLKESVSVLKKVKKADAVGGRLKSIPSSKSIWARAITFVLDSIFGSGGKRYRHREKEGFVKDTLPYCLYKREVFSKIGLFDETLPRGQDAEFNLRLLKKGGKIFFSPNIKSSLFSRASLIKFFHQQFQYGYFKVKIVKKLGISLLLRQLVPALFVFCLFLSFVFSFIFPFSFFIFISILILYFLFASLFSFKIAKKYGLKYFLPCILTFFILHFSYGIGFLKGILDFIILKKEVQKDPGITR